VTDEGGLGEPRRQRTDGAADYPLLVYGERLRAVVQRPRGGREPFAPFTLAEAREFLIPAAVAVANASRDLPPDLRGERVAFQLTLLPNYIAESHYPATLLAAAGLEVIGNRTEQWAYRTQTREAEQRTTKSLIVTAAPTEDDRLVDVMRGVDVPLRLSRRVDSEVPRIAEVRFARRDEVLKLPEDAAEYADGRFEAVLHRGLAGRGSSEGVAGKWSRYLATLGGEMVERYLREVDGILFVPVRLDPAQLARLPEFNPLRALRPMPHIRRFPARGIFRAERFVAPPAPSDRADSAERLAIFDAGADQDFRPFVPYVRAIDLTPQPPDAEMVWHGNAVTSAALFGPNQTGALAVPPVEVDHFRIFPLPPGEEDEDVYWILDRIKETLVGGGYRVVNLSLGPNRACRDDEPDRWTAELDRLARDENVLFVVAAGNNGRLDRESGLSRIQIPGDAVNAVTVGASVDDADGAWTRADYSAVGPGRGGGVVKPTGVISAGHPDGPHLMSLTPEGILPLWGTSLASPLVSRTVGELLADGVSAAPTPNTLRAFVIHFAEPGSWQDAYLDVGHGLLASSLRPYLRNRRNEVRLLYEDVIARDETVALPLPVPDGLPAGYVELTVTVVVTADVDIGGEVGYARQGIEVQFRPHAQRYELLWPDGRTEPLDLANPRPDLAALLAQGVRQTTQPTTRSFGDGRVARSEFERLDEGKWETVFHARTRMRSSSLFRPRIDLTYLARAEGLVADAADLEYSALVTVRMTRDVDIHTRARAQFGVLAPINVRLRAPLSRARV
jgi:hypothetical protein